MRLIISTVALVALYPTHYIVALWNKLTLMHGLF